MAQGTRNDVIEQRPGGRFSPRIPAELRDRLRAVARKRQVSESAITARALERYLPELEKDVLP